MTTRWHQRRSRRTSGRPAACRCRRAALAVALGQTVRVRVRRRGVVGEQPVEAAPGIAQDGRGRLDGGRRSDSGDLHRGDAEIAGQAAKVAAALAAAGPGAIAGLGGVGRGGAATGVGQLERPATVDLLDAHELLVFELLEGRVDGTGARAPAAAASGFELLHDLVAVHRLLGEEAQDRGAQGATAGLGPHAARSLGVIAAVPASAEAVGMAAGAVVAGRVVVSMTAHAADRRVGGMSEGQGWCSFRAGAGALHCALSRYIELYRVSSASRCEPDARILLPEEAPLKLLLTSGGVTNASIRAALVELLGKPIAECHALCIPTAQWGHPMCGPDIGSRIRGCRARLEGHDRPGLGIARSSRAHGPADDRCGAMGPLGPGGRRAPGRRRRCDVPESLDARVRAGRPAALTARQGLGGRQRREHGDDAADR